MNGNNTLEKKRLEKELSKGIKHSMQIKLFLKGLGQGVQDSMGKPQRKEEATKRYTVVKDNSNSAGKRGTLCCHERNLHQI
jgi:hypothetical protein